MQYFEKHPVLFTKNRKRFVQLMQKKSFAVFISNDEIVSNGDALFPYQQNSHLFWQTGIAQPQTMLILCPDSRVKPYREVLAIRRPNPLKEKWDGKQLSKEDATALSGIQNVVWLEDVDAIIQRLANDNEHIYLSSNENDRKPNFIPCAEDYFAEKMKSKFPLHNYLRSALLMKQLRGIKTPEEIKLIKKAIKITQHTFQEVLKSITPDMGENEVEAIIQSNFIANKAHTAYAPIVASGKNACILHYISNHLPCNQGDLVLMDFGARYSGYCADLSRTIPVSGKFSKRQKEVYDACLRLHNYAKSILKPGVSIPDYTEKVGKQATKEFLKIGLLSKQDVKNEDTQNSAYRKYLYHGISHHLGIDVHDVGETVTPVKSGMVFTVEPGIYIAEENMGVRIENNLWITPKGHIDLMKDIPITTEEIEACMKRR